MLALALVGVCHGALQCYRKPRTSAWPYVNSICLRPSLAMRGRTHKGGGTSGAEGLMAARCALGQSLDLGASTYNLKKLLVIHATKRGSSGWGGGAWRASVRIRISGGRWLEFWRGGEGRGEERTEAVIITEVIDRARGSLAAGAAGAMGV